MQSCIYTCPVAHQPACLPPVPLPSAPSLPLPPASIPCSCWPPPTLTCSSLHPPPLCQPLSPSPTPAPAPPLQLLLSSLVCCWCVRLGSYLLYRVIKVGKDSRFDEVKTKPATFFIYWAMQVRLLDWLVSWLMKEIVGHRPTQVLLITSL